MAVTKGGEAQGGELRGDEPEQHDSGVAGTASGVRVERETTPAPPGASEEWAAAVSDRPTSVPTYDVAAVAFESSLRHHRPAGLPLDVAIPMRTSGAVPTGLDLRASFLLLHVDGQSSVRDIAEVTGLPFADVQAAFLSLTAEGLVELVGTHAVQGVPVSGERTRHDGDPEE
jgi:hypothetical protein